MTEGEYNFSEIEEKWKKKWFENNIYAAEDFSDKPKKYILAELPYPSGKSLHIGHAMRYTVPEIYSRFLRMQGYNVMFPMGWDAFGLPTEGYALKANKSPQEVTEELTKNYKKAVQSMGYAVDWNREFSTTDPEYYKWTQWLFLKFYENDLAEIKEMPVWWCEELGNLADEEIITDEEGNKVSERGGHKVERKMFKQWVLKIPQYAEKLLEGLEETDFPDYVKNAQVNWIGKSKGAYVDFIVQGLDKKISVFTTRPDTIYGVTFIALAPENPLLAKIIGRCSNKQEVKKYIKKAKSISDLERQMLKEKTGIELKGVFAIHPLTNKEVPIFVTDYVLMDYGTGSVMGVPGHDERDNEFAKKYGLEIIEVIKPPKEVKFEGPVYVEDGTMINSGKYNGMPSEEFTNKIVEELEELGKGKAGVTYKIRDWVFSRQHYWGEPIPLVYKQDGSAEAIVHTENMDEVHKKLPLTLPYSKQYRPLSDGSAPLARLKDWVKTVDSGGKPAKRETQTMPTWAGSSWYYIRYIDPTNYKEFADMEKMKYWLPVDMYFGGSEHTTVHLLYSRFWHKFFYDLGIVPTSEPYQWRMNGGLLLAEDGKKMSKRLGNVIEPQRMIDKYGADATRISLAFLGPYTGTYPWNEGSIKATYSLLNTINNLKNKVAQESEKDENLIKAYHKMIKNITTMINDLKMNTSVSEIMIFVNKAKNFKTIGNDIWEGFLKVLAPFAPFLAEQLWVEFNLEPEGEWTKELSIHWQNWPDYDEEIVRDNVLVIPIQINGKVRDEVEIERDEGKDSVKNKTLAKEKVIKYVGNREVKQFIYIPNEIINIVV